MSAKPQTTKQELLSAVLETRTAVLQAASVLSPTAQDTVFLGVWSVADLIAHLVGWDYANLAAAKDIQAGKLPEFYAHYDKDWKTYNAALVAKYKRDDLEEFLALARDSHNQVDRVSGKHPGAGLREGFWRALREKLHGHDCALVAGRVAGRSETLATTPGSLGKIVVAKTKRV